MKEILSVGRTEEQFTWLLILLERRTGQTCDYMSVLGKWLMTGLDSQAIPMGDKEVWGREM